VSLFAISPGTVKTDLMDYTTDRLSAHTELGAVLGPLLAFIPPTFAADLIIALGSGKADALTGRYLTVHDDLPAYIKEITDDPASERGKMRVIGG
jgi:hypothetical protein